MATSHLWLFILRFQGCYPAICSPRGQHSSATHEKGREEIKAEGDDAQRDERNEFPQEYVGGISRRMRDAERDGGGDQLGAIGAVKCPGEVCRQSQEVDGQNKQQSQYRD